MRADMQILAGRAGRQRPRGRRRRGAGGFTLTELMVVMGLSGLVVAALLSVAQVHGRNEQQAQQGQQAMENARGALEEIAQSARSTTAWMASSRLTGVAVGAAPPLPAQQVYNRAPNKLIGDLMAIQVKNNAGVDGSDIVMLMPTEPGYHAGGGPQAVVPTNPPQPAMSTLTSKFDPNSTTLTVDSLGPAGQQWAAGDYAAVVPVGFAGAANTTVLWDFRTAYLVAVQNVAGNTLTVSNPDLVAGNPSVYPGGLVFRVRPVTYLIRPYFNTAVNSTERTLLAIDGGPFADGGKGPFSDQELGFPLPNVSTMQVVAENIVDLQVALWYDCNNNGRVDEIGTAVNDDELVFNVANEIAVPPLGGSCALGAKNPVSAAQLPGAGNLNPMRISGVRISVVSRTSQPLETLGPGRPPVEDRAADPPFPVGADFNDATTIPFRYRYRVQRTFVYFRNAALSQ